MIKVKLSNLIKATMINKINKGLKEKIIRENITEIAKNEIAD